MAKAKKMVSFYADPAQWDELKQRSIQTGSSVGWLARKAITEALIRWKDEDALLEKFRQTQTGQTGQTPIRRAPAKAPAKNEGRMFRGKPALSSQSNPVR